MKLLAYIVDASWTKVFSSDSIRNWIKKNLINKNFWFTEKKLYRKQKLTFTEYIKILKNSENYHCIFLKSNRFENEMN